VPAEPGAPAAFRAWVRAHTAELLTDPTAAAAVTAAQRALAAQDAGIARLRGELDRYHGRAVYFCTEAHAPAAQATLTAEPGGTVLRATDTGQEWELRGGAWLPR
jgi:hypothetical protein